MNEELKNVQALDDAELNEATGGAGQARWITYTIKRGDTLIKIAKRYNTTEGQIMSWNPKIKNKNLIYAGDYLYIKQ